MDEDLKKEAEEMMDILAERNRTTAMGLLTDETAYFNVLLWLFADGEKPDIE